MIAGRPCYRAANSAARPAKAAPQPPSATVRNRTPKCADSAHNLIIPNHIAIFILRTFSPFAPAKPQISFSSASGDERANAVCAFFAPNPMIPQDIAVFICRRPIALCKVTGTASPNPRMTRNRVQRYHQSIYRTPVVLRAACCVHSSRAIRRRGVVCPCDV